MGLTRTDERFAGGWRMVLRAACLLFLACLLFAGAGESAWAKVKSKADEGPVCDKSAPSDDDDDDADGITFKAGAACMGLSGEFDAIGQAANVNEPRLAGSNNSSSALTLNPDLRVEAALPKQWATSRRRSKPSGVM